MRSLLPWTVAFALLALPGCLSDGGDDDGAGTPDPDDPDPPLGAEPKVFDGSGTIQAGAGTPVISFVNGATGAEFTVPANATLLFVELAWSSAAVALDLCIHAPSDGDTQGVPNCGVVEDGGSPGMPAGLVTHTRAAPEAGSGWGANPYVDGPAADQDFELKVTLFFGETSVPEDYSALA
jgi:hypothetical protein